MRSARLTPESSRDRSLRAPSVPDLRRSAGLRPRQDQHLCGRQAGHREGPGGPHRRSRHGGPRGDLLRPHFEGHSAHQSQVEDHAGGGECRPGAGHHQRACTRRSSRSAPPIGSPKSSSWQRIQARNFMWTGRGPTGAARRTTRRGGSRQSTPGRTAFRRTGRGNWSCTCARRGSNHISRIDRARRRIA